MLVTLIVLTVDFQVSLVSVCLVTVSGLHMVWTHVWLVASAALLLTGDAFALSVAACLGANISAVWYISLTRRSQMAIPSRAMHGWSRWICEDLFNKQNWQGRVSFRLIHSLPTGFFITDMGVHLLPTLVLLQLSAEHITPLSVVLGYVKEASPAVTFAMLQVLGVKGVVGGCYIAPFLDGLGTAQACPTLSRPIVILGCVHQSQWRAAPTQT